MHRRFHGLFASVFLTALVGCGTSSSGAPSSSTSSGGTSSGGTSSGGTSSGGTSSGGTSSGGTSSGGGTSADPHWIPADATWRSSSEWYRDISAAPVAEHSAEMLGAINRWGQTGIFQIDFSFVVLDGAGASPVRFPPGEETDDVPVPVPAAGYIEGEYAYDACPNADEDCHLLVVDRGAKRLFEVYQARKGPAGWEGSLAYWQLDKAYPRTARGQGCTSADAAGLAITPGLIGFRETKAGTIAHALRLVLRNDVIRGGKSRDVPLVAYPATHGSLATSSAKGVPYGARLRLKASVSENDPRFTTPGAKAVLAALRRYGMIVADGGNIPLMAESDRVYRDANPADTWENLLGPRDVGPLVPSDFEVVGIPKDVPGGAAGYYATRAEYEAQLKKPLGCAGIVQP